MAEAAVLVLAAAGLVRWVRFARWRPLLCSAAGCVTDADVATAVQCAIARAERRLLGRRFKCLPRAMAMQAMLRRRGVASSLVIGAATQPRRGGRRDLHAWVECDGVVVIGASAGRTFVSFLSAR